tara:strand:+ start:257 stop:1000 length:744 start_codon:yes stop_codon:yes gene_type:complete
MSKIKSKNTKPELLMKEILLQFGFRILKTHSKTLIGKPDFVLPDKVVVFVDGAFWHGHPDYYKPGKSGLFWDNKIAANITRDRKVDGALYDAGYVVVRFWDIELFDRDNVINLLRECILQRKSYSSVIGIRPSLKNYFLLLAKNIALRSPCPPGKRHGAVIVNVKNKIISTGYNGLLENEQNCSQCTLLKISTIKCWQSCPAIHAEMNAIFNLEHQSDASRMYVTKKPCNDCFRALKRVGIAEVFYE